MVDSRDSHWHHHSAGAVEAVRGGDGRVGPEGAEGGVSITKGKQLYRPH